MQTMTDRERLIELLESAFEFYIDDPYCIPDEGDFADHLLANGVIAQKQGEWKIHQNDGYWHYDCPFCDDGYATKGKDNTPPNFCGNCGAKLKERVDNG